MIRTLLITSFLASPAFAVRTAVFPPELKNRAAVWLDQKRIFSAEMGSDKTRPIWIHGGDSISTAWSNGASLRDKLARAELKPLPVARSVDDMLEHFPDAARTWYAGRNFEYGVFGALERLAGRGPWVIISSALAGATATPKPPVDMRAGEDPFVYMAQSDQPDRVRLVTFSLGSNDICDNLTPLSDEPGFRAKLKNLVRVYPHALIVPFKVTPVKTMRNHIMARLAALPDSIGKKRVIEYCTNMWNGVCRSTTGQSTRADELADQLGKVYEEEVGPLFDSLSHVNDMDLLDLISSDCFHPSAMAESRIHGPLSQFALERLKSR